MKKDPTKDRYNRSTLEVAKTIIDKEIIHTRNKDYLKEEGRLAFLSVWTAFNLCFTVIADLYENPALLDREIQKKVEAIYLGIPTGFNLPLEDRIPPQARTMKLAEADAKAGDNKIIVKGYNDDESKQTWENIAEEKISGNVKRSDQFTNDID